MRKHLSLISAAILLTTSSGCYWGWGHGHGGYDDRDRGGHDDGKDHDDHH